MDLLYRFKQTPKCVLLATDVAARGLDIPSVDHVIHYQIPRTADVYVHRNGRTARAMLEGFGLLMCAPDERKLLRSLLGSLKRSKNTLITPYGQRNSFCFNYLQGRTRFLSCQWNEISWTSSKQGLSLLGRLIKYNMEWRRKSTTRSG